MSTLKSSFTYAISSGIVTCIGAKRLNIQAMAGPCVKTALHPRPAAACQENNPPVYNK